MRTGRSWRRTRSPPGSTIRARGPSTRICATPAARATSRSATTRRWAALQEVSRLEGIIPALETSHAFAWLLGPGRSEPPAGDGPDLLCLSGRGDKDLAEVLERIGSTDPVTDG